MPQRAFFWTQGKLFPLYGGSILDNYVVKLYARAYRDLDGIYTYIAETLLCAENKERGAYRHSTLYNEQLLKLNLKDEKRQSDYGLPFFAGKERLYVSAYQYAMNNHPPQLPGNLKLADSHCARFIQKYTENEVKTISAHVAPKKDLDKPSRFHQFDIREHIEKLVAEGKMEEAAALMDEI